jgi:hypothetical protein
MGGNSTTQKENKVENKDPWSGQQPYLTDAFQKAFDVNKAQTGTPGYTGDFYAAPTQEMRDAFANAFNTSTDTGALQAAIQNANSLTPKAYANADTAQNYAQDMMNRSAGFAGQGIQEIQAGNTWNGIGQALTQKNAGQLNDLANSDLTGKNIANAGRYANNPFMDGMIQSALRDGQRAVTEQVLPSINRSAGGTGNYNSSRAGIADGMVARGWSDQAADVSAGLRGQAYQSGITASQNDTSNMISALMNSGQLGNAISNNGIAQINAGNGILNTSNATASIGNDWSNTGNAWANTGLNAANTTGNLTGRLADVNGANLANLIQSTTMLNGFDQQALDNAMAKQQYQDDRPWDSLSKYYSIVGDKSWGGTTNSSGTTTKQENPSIMSSIGGGLGLIGSLFRCDRRVKTDIELVATLPDGIPLYNFRYLDDPAGHIHTAPMAQDVQKKYPEAVIEIDGVLHIDTNHYDWR